MSTGFPELIDSFLFGQDILYTQFNEIEFYVEDIDQEHFYFNIFKTLFPGLIFEKIFPLNGKKNVTDSARINVGNKKKIFIVDLDFDHITNSIEYLDNLFYLKRYSIENYLFSKDAIYEIIRGKDSKLKNQDIDNLFNYSQLLFEATICLKELSCSFVIIKINNLGLEYYGLDVNRDFDFSSTPPYYRMHFIKTYFKDVDNSLKSKNRRFSFERRMRIQLKDFKTFADCIAYIPGKYILTFLKDRLTRLRLINQMSIESFTYSLSKDFKSNELDYLKTNIINYIS